ncbi:MAG: hypothetical protein FJ255_02830 [Phycisphaerae bacterium]|nr:hypothetical protein [Phycisphaerae bacterium]
MALVIAGIDEAGYGPMLGPLCVGLSVFRVDGWEPGSPAPDLWARLAPAVGRTPREARGGVAIADSKELKLPNDTKSRHPLTHLERGVLTVARAMGVRHDDDAALLDWLGVELDEHDCYAGPALPLPLAHTPGQIAIAANPVTAACERAGVRPELLACRAIAETEFNRIVRDEGSKALATFAAVGQHLRLVCERWGGEHAWVMCDRLGGRVEYGRALERLVPGAAAEVVGESPERSIYRLRLPSGGVVGVTFKTEGEKAQMPVALASMIAKLVRELAMIRFNRHWSGRNPELKPTAGYVTDARRWLRDAGDLLSRDDRVRLIRRA